MTARPIPHPPTVTPVPPPALYKPITLKELNLLPKPVWLIKHWAMRESVTVLVGKSESFKTFVAMDLAMKAGDPGFTHFLNHKINRDTATAFGGGLRVLYIIGESMGSAGRRFTAIKQYHALKDYPDTVMVHPGRVDIMYQPDEVYRLVDEVDPDIVIFDTWSRNTYGMNENDKSDVDKALVVAHNIKFGGTRGGRSVIFIHHPPAADQGKPFRGHTALLNDTDIMISAKRWDEAKDNPVAPFYTELKSMRQKEVDDFFPYWVTLDLIHLKDEATGLPEFWEDGAPLTVPVITATGDVPVGSEGTSASPLADSVVAYIESNPTTKNPTLQRQFWPKNPGGNHAANMTARLKKEGRISGNARDGFVVVPEVEFTKADPTSTLEEL